MLTLYRRRSFVAKLRHITVHFGLKRSQLLLEFLALGPNRRQVDLLFFLKRVDVAWDIEVVVVFLHLIMDREVRILVDCLSFFVGFDDLAR